jgi:hypothetical protein
MRRATETPMGSAPSAAALRSFATTRHDDLSRHTQVLLDQLAHIGEDRPDMADEGGAPLIVENPEVRLVAFDRRWFKAASALLCAAGKPKSP